MAYRLAKTLADVEGDLLDEGNEEKLIGFDTETTGLDTRRAKLVGVSFSMFKEVATYVPIGHRIGSNLPLKPVVNLFKRKAEQGYRFVFYNAKFDLNILQVNCGWVPILFEDALELVYMADPDRRDKRLKTVVKEDFGVDMTRFEDLFTPEEQKAKVFDISTKSPARCTDYASMDADFALRLRYKYGWLWEPEGNPFALRVDNALIEVVRRMEHNGGMELNTEYVEEQIEILGRRGDALKEQIHRVVGKDFEIKSPKQLGDALFETMGIPSPGYTRAGKNHKTDAETLEKLSKTYPVIEVIICYRKVIKARDAYFVKLQTLAKTGKPIRFNFNMFAAPTFRFAAPGGDPNKDGACGVNIQAVGKGEAREMFGVDLSLGEGNKIDYAEELTEDETLFEREAAEIDEGWEGKIEELPWVAESEVSEGMICFRETCTGCRASCRGRGIDTTRRLQTGVKIIPPVREAFKSPEGYSLVSFDYDRQELVIGANLSGEPKWLQALANGEDLHVSTAAAAFGMPQEVFVKLPTEEFKRKRAVGKTLNFATFYGATGYTLSRKADITIQQAEQIYEGFVHGHPQLFSWINKVHIFARKEGYTTTYFGRKRWLKQFYNHDNPRMKAFADRSAVNTTIQGTAAEVTRIAMVKVYKALRKAGYTDKQVRLLIQIHDELMYMIKDELIEEIVPIIRENMQFNVKSWIVQLTVGVKIGKVWGLQEEMKEIPLAA